MDKFDELNERLVALRKLSEELTLIERKRQQLKLIKKAIYISNELFAVERRLKMPSHTTGDLKRHMQLLAKLKILFGTDEDNSPVNVIQKEVELVSRLFSDLMQTYKDILAELF